MELIPIFFLWVVVTLLGCGLWIWWKANGSFQQILDQLRYRIRSVLRVASVNELEVVQENLLHLEKHVYAQMASLNTKEKFSPELQKCPQAIDPPFVYLEQSGDPTLVMDVPFPRPRSIVWNGLRFTLSDSLWAHMGVMPREKVEDGQVQAMVHGPFCRVCLKRLVERDRVHAAEVPGQCRHCGVSWSSQESDRLPISLVDLKRQMYNSLDRKLRTSRGVQC